MVCDACSVSTQAWEHAKEVKKSSKDAAKIAEEVKLPATAGKV